MPRPPGNSWFDCLPFWPWRRCRGSPGWSGSRPIYRRPWRTRRDGGTGRLRQGFELLAQDRAEELFVSGVGRGVKVVELLRIDRIAPPELACCVVLGYQAGDTHGNALETAAWMRTQGFTSLRLVTATYHMPRSLLEFRAAMPGAEILPHPVFSRNFRQADWWQWPGSTMLLAKEYNKYLLAWARSRLLERAS